MLSLFTYGATYGIAESPANTCHELNHQPNSLPESGSFIASEFDAFEHDTQEQRATRGAGIGWLKRLFQRKT